MGPPGNILEGALAFEADLRDLAASDDHVYTYVETWAEAPGTGRGVNYTTMTVYRIRGGQVVEVRQHVDDVTAYGAFWSGLSPESGNGEPEPEPEPEAQQPEPEVQEPEPEPAPPPRKKGFARFRS